MVHNVCGIPDSFLVRYGEDRDSALEFLKCRANTTFSVWIKSGRCFIQNEKLGVSHKSSRNGHALPLPPRELRAMLPDNGFNPVRATGHKTPSVSVFQRLDQIVLRDRFVSECDVLSDRVMEKQGFLGDIADLTPPFIDIKA